MSVGFLFVEVQFDADPDKCVAHTERIVKHCLNIVLNVISDAFCHLYLVQSLHIQTLFFYNFIAFVFIENIAFFVNESDIFRQKSLNTVADQVYNSFNLGRRQSLIFFEHEHD